MLEVTRQFSLNLVSKEGDYIGNVLKMVSHPGVDVFILLVVLFCPIRLVFVFHYFTKGWMPVNMWQNACIYRLDKRISFCNVFCQTIS